MTTERAPFRIPRAGVLSVTVLGLAAAAHLSAGGHLPAAPVMAALTAVVTVSAVLLAGRKMTFPVLAGYLAAGQVVLHLVFSALPGAGGATPGPVHHLRGVVTAAPGPVDGAIPHEHLSADASPAMLCLHLVATLATALMLARGEAALWALAAWLRPFVELPEPSGLSPGLRTTVTGGKTISQRWRGLGQPPMRGPPSRTANRRKHAVQEAAAAPVGP